MIAADPFARRPFREAPDRSHASMPLGAVTPAVGRTSGTRRAAWPLKSSVSLALALIVLVLGWLLFHALRAEPSRPAGMDVSHMPKTSAMVLGEDAGAREPIDA